MSVYNKYSDHLRQRYGQKVYKLPINLPVTCPNRDGTAGLNGCAFCGEDGAGFESHPQSMPVAEQIRLDTLRIAPKYKARKFIAYFQNFSNTYLPVEELEAYVMEACQPDIVGIAISTRPDCINQQQLQILNRIQAATGVDITVELGLQTVNYRTLAAMNRGHTLAEFLDAVLRIKAHSLEVCAHLILNLPGDDWLDVIENAKILSAMRVDQVKLHALYIMNGTKMAEWYEAGTIQLISQTEYIERVVAFLSYLHPEIVVQRLIGRAPREGTVFVNWQTSWWKIQEQIEQRMIELDIRQGCKCDYLNGSATNKRFGSI
ncbi:MAG: hypothetical protein H6Q65_1287 [Firmicutes bacterium]|nr:hypothetical protein [Bacillota bacterium]